MFYTDNFPNVGLSLHELPPIIPLDGHPLAEWIRPAHRVHALSEVNPDDDSS